LWHTDPLQGNDRETNETTTIARQQLLKYATVLESLLGSGLRAIVEVLLEVVFSVCPLRGYITRLTEFCSVSAAHWDGASWLLGE
jgi:hypothetical protein